MLYAFPAGSQALHKMKHQWPRLLHGDVPRMLLNLYTGDIGRSRNASQYSGSAGSWPCDLLSCIENRRDMLRALNSQRPEDAEHGCCCFSGSPNLRGRAHHHGDTAEAEHLGVQTRRPKLQQIMCVEYEGTVWHSIASIAKALQSGILAGGASNRTTSRSKAASSSLGPTCSARQLQCESGETESFFAAYLCCASLRVPFFCMTCVSV